MDMMNIYFIATIVIFGVFMLKVLERMFGDPNVIVRLLGYAVAIVVATGVLWLVLNVILKINILTYLQ